MGAEDPVMLNPVADCDLSQVTTPSYIINETLLEQNCKLLAAIQERTGCTILLALKGFAMHSTFPLIKKHLKGTCVSSVNEARLGYEEFGGEVHAYAPAYSKQDIQQLIPLINHISFNSFNQWEKYKPLFKQSSIKCGLRVNPVYSEVKTPLYDPCMPGSRLGITKNQFRSADMDGITGLHFHTLCEQNTDTLERTITIIEKAFGELMHKMEWINFGGGHHITREDYKVDLLCEIITRISTKYNCRVYLEPGEAIALNAGVLVATVLDIIYNKMAVAILDTSAAAHMPDVLEMPYRPEIVHAAEPGTFAHTYRLGGLTCLAGDVIGDYSFEHPLKIDDKLIFLDMAHYTMVKNTTFNGIALPSIAIYNSHTQQLKMVKKFDYLDYKNKLS